jgi:hypothetical protein
MCRSHAWLTLVLVLVLVGTTRAPISWAAQETLTDEPTERPTDPWYATVVGGVYSGSRLVEIPMGLDLKDSYTFGLSVSKQFAEWTRYMRWEGELQVFKHFGEQEHWEFTGSVNLRWVVFPWNKYVETTAAIGEGGSWATEIPALERAAASNKNSEQLLNYILLEATFAVPDTRWSLVTRIHHRSGVWGLLGDNGSNIIETGIRYRF